MSKSVPIETIDLKIQTVKDSMAEIADRLDSLNNEQDILLAKQKGLEHETRLYLDLLKAAVESGGRAATIGGGQRRLRTTTRLITDFIDDRPGSTQSAVANALQDRIQTKSASPRRIVLNTIINLVRHGRLLKSSDGRLSLNGSAELPSSMKGGI